MGLRPKALFITSVAASMLSCKFMPELALFPRSLFWNTVVLYIALLCANLIWTILIYPHFFSPLRHLPQPPGGHFVFGHVNRIFREPSGQPQKHWIDSVDNDGVIYYRWLFNEPRVLVTSPKALAEVLVQRNYEFVKPSRVRTGLGELLGVGILLAEGDEHKRQRRALMPAFSFRHIRDLYPVFWSKSREMTQAMQKHITLTGSSVVDIRDWASRATLDIIGVAGMGQDFNAIADPSSALNQTYATIFNSPRGPRFLRLMFTFLPPWLLRLLPLKLNDVTRDAVRTIQKVARDLIASKRTKLAKGERTDPDILSVALESGNFTDDDLVNQLMTFLAAGHETTASAIAWAMYLLVEHPHVQTKLREEIHANLPSIDDESAQITSQDIDKLPYLNAVLNETLRSFPPVPLTLRETTDDTTIQGHLIPASTTVVICPWATNLSYAFWGDDAKAFRPERWLGPGRMNTGGAASNYAVTTFLHGPRSCIGKDFAKAEFACLVAALVGRFEMELEDPEYKLEIQGGITAKPKGGLKVRLKSVEGW